MKKLLSIIGITFIIAIGGFSGCIDNFSEKGEGIVIAVENIGLDKNQEYFITVSIKNKDEYVTGAPYLITKEGSRCDEISPAHVGLEPGVTLIFNFTVFNLPTNQTPKTFNLQIVEPMVGDGWDYTNEIYVVDIPSYP